MGSLFADDSAPRVDTTITHRALGSLKILGGDIHEAWVQISHPKYDPSEINCILQTKTPWGSFLLPMNSVMDWSIEAESPAPHLVRFWPLGNQSYSGTLARLELDAYEIVPSPDEIISGDQLRVTIELSRRGVLPPRENRILRFEGIIAGGNEAPPSLKWETHDVENEMFVRYTYERALAGGDESHLQIERPCIIQKRRTSSSTSIREIFEAVQSEVFDYLLILAFVSREPIDWYQIDAERTRRQSGGGFFKGRFRRVVTERLLSRRKWPLVEYSALTAGLFQRMATTLQDSSAKDALRRAISFDVASWVQRGLEDSFVFCQAALEAVIGILEEDVPVLRESEAPRKKIEKNVTACLKQLRDNETLSARAYSLIKKKVLELKRVPIEDQILFHAKRLGVTTSDLWPKAVSFQDGLHLALKQRNLLVHAAHIEDPNEVYSNLIRMRTLVERFILAYMKVRPDEVSWLHDQPVRRVNRK